MTKLDIVIERLKALPPAEQEVLADEIELMLEGEGPALSDEQWAEVERRLADESEETIPHEEVVSQMRAKFGG